MQSRNIKFLHIFLHISLCFLVWRHALKQYSWSLKSFHPSSVDLNDSNPNPLTDPPTMHPSYYSNRKREVLGTQNSNILHFMQISDLHVSMFAQKGGLAHLEAVLYSEVPLIAPELVLATGDLTDGKATHFLTSQQQEKEWRAYYDLLKASRVMERSNGSFYFDQRGNHDCWNVGGWSSYANYFKGLSAVKREGYSTVVKKDFGLYSFVALDGCPKTGPGRPFNFFGYFDSSDMDFLASVLLVAIKERHNHTFAMSHYPTGTTLFGKDKNGVGFWGMTQHVSVWLCGHLHNLAGGLGDQMYAFQKEKVLELELGDMKSHGMVRIVAIDHDLVSFVDVPLYQDKTAGKLPLPISQSYRRPSTRPPIVLITNPKDARFMIPQKEPVSLIKDSSHIRVIVWATTETLKSVSCFIDGTRLGDDTKAEYHGKGKKWSSITNLEDSDPYVPLWTIPWNASRYDDNEMHYLTVVAVDESGMSGNQTVRFRIDGKRIMHMDSGPGGFIISLPLGLLFKDLFLLTYLIVVVGFLVLPKIFVLLLQGLGIYEEWKARTSANLVALDTESEQYWRQVRPDFKVQVRHQWIDFKFTMVATFLRFCELSRISDLYYPLFLWSLYVTVGPWFVGDFVPSTDLSIRAGKRWGWLMSYGVWLMDGEWEPILDTWVYAWYGLLYTLFPLLFYLSFCILPPRLLYSSSNTRLVDPIHLRSSIRYIVIGVLVYHFLDTCSMTIFYGLVSTIISPGKTWPVIWAFFKLRKFGVFRKHSPSGALVDSSKSAAVKVD